MDKGQRKRIADVAEKLGVGLLLATVVQGILAEKLPTPSYSVGVVILAIAAVLLILAVYLSKEI